MIIGGVYQQEWKTALEKGIATDKGQISMVCALEDKLGYCYYTPKDIDLSLTLSVLYTACFFCGHPVIHICFFHVLIQLATFCPIRLRYAGLLVWNGLSADL